jgi:hypothetical protein
MDIDLLDLIFVIGVFIFGIHIIYDGWGDR